MLKRFFFGCLLLSGLLVATPYAQAIGLDVGLEDAGTAATYSSQDPAVIVGTLIKVVVGLLGIIFLILTIYAGVLWMTAAGDDKQVAKAKSILTSSVVGLVIVLSAYAITDFVVNNLTNATGIGRGQYQDGSTYVLPPELPEGI